MTPEEQRIAELEAELEAVRKNSLSPAPAPDTATIYWVETMRGEQPRCRKCDSSLTRGPRGGVIESECPNCHMELRNGTPPAVETR